MPLNFYEYPLCLNRQGIGKRGLKGLGRKRGMSLGKREGMEYGVEAMICYVKLAAS